MTREQRAADLAGRIVRAAQELEAIRRAFAAGQTVPTERLVAYEAIQEELDTDVRELDRATRR